MFQNLPEVIAALGFFGAVVIFPITFLFLRHQRAMAELIHRGAPNDANPRIEALEREVKQLKAALHQRIIQEDDRTELSSRVQ